MPPQLDQSPQKIVMPSLMVFFNADYESQIPEVSFATKKVCIRRDLLRQWQANRNETSTGQLKCDGTRKETRIRLSCETDESI
jgi:hypothetical protein